MGLQVNILPVNSVKRVFSATLLPAGKDIEVHIQGNLGHDVVGYLGKQYKINAKYCVVEWGKGLKQKK